MKYRQNLSFCNNDHFDIYFLAIFQKSYHFYLFSFFIHFTFFFFAFRKTFKNLESIKIKKNVISS